MLLLPYRLLLQCGYEVLFSTAEILWQNERTLVIRADRPTTVSIRTPSATPVFDVDDQAGDVRLLESGQGAVTFECAGLPAIEWRRAQLGSLGILLLGQRLVDTFWVNAAGSMTAGADALLPDGGYGLAQNSRVLLHVSEDGRTVRKETPPEPGRIITSLLSEWDILDEAPELSHPAAFDTAFRLVSPEAPDFDANGIYEGSAWYRLTLSGNGVENRPRSIEIDARHFWSVCLNGHLLGEGHHLTLIHGLDAPLPGTLEIPASLWKDGGKNDLMILVSGLGHPKGFMTTRRRRRGCSCSAWMVRIARKT